MLKLEDIDRAILRVLTRQGRTNSLRLAQVAQGPVIDRDEIRHRLVKLEMLGLIEADHSYRATDAGRSLLGGSSEPDGNPQAA